MPRELETERDRTPMPWLGGTRGYDVHWREDQVRNASVGLPVRACRMSIWNWNQRMDPFRMTGNKENDTLTGIYQILLLIFLMAYPEARTAEVRAFVANTSNGRVFSRGQVSCRLAELEITRKRASTEAYQAYTAINLHKRDVFFTHNLPFGIANAERRSFLDTDECGLELQSCNRGEGYAYSGVRVVKPGNYCRDTKISVILTIEPGDARLPPHVLGSVERPRRWGSVNPVAGTTTEAFERHMREVLEDLRDNPPPGLPPGPPERRNSLWDNLYAHKSPIIYQLVEAEFGHRIMCRPPYRPADGPIEYIFCQLADHLRNRLFSIKTMQDLINEINNIIGQLNDFDETFDHCEYP